MPADRDDEAVAGEGDLDGRARSRRWAVKPSSMPLPCSAVIFVPALWRAKRSSTAIVRLVLAGSVVLMTSAPPRSALEVPPTNTPASPIQPSTSLRRSSDVCFWNCPSSALTPTPVNPPPPATVCSTRSSVWPRLATPRPSHASPGSVASDVRAAAAGASRTCGVPMLTASTRSASGWACSAGADRLGRRARERLQHRADLRVAARLLGDGAQRGPGRRGRRARCGPGRPSSARRSGRWTRRGVLALGVDDGLQPALGGDDDAVVDDAPSRSSPCGRSGSRRPCRSA